MTPIKLEEVLNDFDYTKLADTILPGESTFPWYYYSTTAYRGTDAYEKLYQFVHTVYRDNQVNSHDYLYNIVTRILEKVETQIGSKLEIERAKFNLLPRQPFTDEDLIPSIHTDKDEEGYVSIIYYLEDSDGDTVIYNNHHEEKQRYTPQANTCIIFDSNTWHRATPPTINKVRRIINIVAKVL